MMHAMAHLSAIVLASWGAIRITTDLLRLASGSLRGIVTDAVLIFFGGYVLGSLLMGLYLFISLRFFRRHSNEAFSALHIPDYKNFVRMYIDHTGRLTIYPIGLRRVPRSWANQGSNAQEPVYVPDSEYKIDCELIEPPIMIAS
jgi:hypothetical protein